MRMSAVEAQIGQITGGVDVQGLMRVQEEQTKNIQALRSATSTWGGQRKGGILESKVWAGIKTLTAERAQFKEMAWQIEERVWTGKTGSEDGIRLPGKMAYRWNEEGNMARRCQKEQRE